MKVVILLSGGLDSAVCLWLARERGLDILALSVSYGSKHGLRERAQARELVNEAGVYHRVIDLDTVFAGARSTLLLGQEDVPEGHHESPSMATTVVPFRNGVLLACAVAVAESWGAAEVWYGAHAGDRGIYPDCRPEFADAFSDAAHLGTGGKVRVVAPLSGMRKAEVVWEALRLGVPLERTWSCYQGGQIPCGKCAACTERAEAFALCGVADPLLTVSN